MSNARVPGPLGLSPQPETGDAPLSVFGWAPVPGPVGLAVTSNGAAPHGATPTVERRRSRRLLRQGSRGDAVCVAQRLLNERGAQPKLAIDGIFGPLTNKAVLEFQRSREILVDGIVGPQTWRWLRRDERGRASPGAAPKAEPPPPTKPAVAPKPAPAPAAPAPAAPAPAAANAKRLTEIRWIEQETYCGGPATLAGTTVNYADGETEAANVLIKGGAKVASVQLAIAGNKFSQKLDVKDWLPRKVGADFEEARDQDAEAAGQKTAQPLKMKFIPKLALAESKIGTSQFHLEVKNYDCQVQGKVEYVQGYMAWLIQLGSTVSDAPGILRVLLPSRLLNALFTPGGQTGVNWGAENPNAFSGSDWRFAKDDHTSPTKLSYWNGKEWKHVPNTWQDTNNVKLYGIGIWRESTKNKAQFGNEWPEDIPTWSADNQALATNTFKTWVANCKSAWSGKFDLRRDACASANDKCCRYPVSVAVSFTCVKERKGHAIVVGVNNGRSNAGAWSLGDTRPGLAPHEFGHHLGAPDEYPGGVGIDTTVNDDGATAGIDPTSLMGSVPAAGIPPVKARHFKVVSQHLTAMIKAQKGVEWPMKTLPHT